MSPKVGQSLPHLMFNDCKLIRAVKITAVSDDSRSVTFTGKRGALTVTACRTPRELQRAVRQAAELTKIRELGEQVAGAAGKRRAIAVVAFDNYSGDKALEWMRQGIRFG